eukprot:4435967-Prymnesium_polylepis.1
MQWSRHQCSLASERGLRGRPVPSGGRPTRSASRACFVITGGTEGVNAHTLPTARVGLVA